MAKPASMPFAGLSALPDSLTIAGARFHCLAKGLPASDWLRSFAIENLRRLRAARLLAGRKT
jgi:hypothetical protein